ncbi:SufE family protein [Agarivorans sp. MS3-6]|uniref:SufE family protein n=1 Tax=Agarivorans sp. TSD2052 TaxID=2937286 RepID=UPI00200D5826|nr:SufE family protein [Agarivorans sp. TSD2052]UPW20244.1 SufE family protein [Agarivorans sp. TSD2052]
MNNTPQIALSLAQIEQRFSNCKAWEESYRQLLLLAKQLQAIDEQFKTPDNKVIGCESEVWLLVSKDQLFLDSNARIIRGLIVVILACLQALPQQIEPAEELFRQTLDKLGLAHHLSQSRNNGITAIWDSIKSYED